jgi:hypothetical protein
MDRAADGGRDGRAVPGIPTGRPRGWGGYKKGMKGKMGISPARGSAALGPRGTPGGRVGGACWLRKDELIPRRQGRGLAADPASTTARPGPLPCPLLPGTPGPRSALPALTLRPAHLPLPYVLPSRCNKVASTSCTRRGAGPGGAGARGAAGPASSPATAAGPRRRRRGVRAEPS